MDDFTNTRKQDSLTGGSRSELRTAALVVLARVIAKAYLRKTTADKNSGIEITLSDSQRNPVNDICNRDGSQL